MADEEEYDTSDPCSMLRRWFKYVWDPTQTDKEMAAHIEQFWAGDEAKGVAGKAVNNREAVVSAMLWFRRALPGARIKVDQMMANEEGKVLLSAMLSWDAAPPLGRLESTERHEIPFFASCTVEADGRISDAHNSFDTLLLCEKLGWECSNTAQFWERLTQQHTVLDGVRDEQRHARIILES